MNIIDWRDSLLESDLNYKAKFVGLVLSQYYRPNHSTYPSIRTLSQMSGLTVNPVQDGIDILIKNEFIKREKKRLSGDRYLSNIYTFIGVTETRTISPHDTSNDTSNDTSHDTSHDTSPRDTKIEEIDKEEEVVKKTSKKKVTLNELSVDHVKEWLAKKRAQGKYINHNEHDILETFKNYVESKGKKYENYIAAYRNSFEWDRNQPKTRLNNQDKHQRTLEAATRGHIRAKNLDF